MKVDWFKDGDGPSILQDNTYYQQYNIEASVVIKY
jgi:hypothetical protein